MATLILEYRKRYRQVIAQAAQRLLAKLPESLRDDPNALALAQLRCEQAVDVVHLIYHSKHYESQSKDYEFSRLSMQEHWAAGRANMACTLDDPRWIERERSTTGVHVFDLTAGGPSSLHLSSACAAGLSNKQSHQVHAHR